MRMTVGTESEIKLGAVRLVLGQLLKDHDFEVIGQETDSGVPPTPWNEETLHGAQNRARACRAEGADYRIGLESGLVERFGMVFEEAWACVIDAKNNEVLGFSSGLRVPDYVLREMKENGEEHRHTMRRLRKNPDGPKDTWGDYSGGLILRTVSLEESLRNALIQVLAPADSYYKK